MQIGILEPDNFSERAMAALRDLGPVHGFAGGDMAAFLRDKEALFVRLARRIDEPLLRMAPRLKFLCSPTTGHTHIDEDALRRRGVALLSLKGERAFLETVRASPEHAFGLILALLRRYAQAFRGLESPDWDRDRYRGVELYENSVGIVGLGRMGSAVAGYCRAFGAEVAFVDPSAVPAPPEYRRFTDLTELLRASRIVVICASHEAGRPPILGAPEIAFLQGKYLVNAARGELVDEPALLAAIGRDSLAGVATDVIANETGPNRLGEWLRVAAGRNVIVTPHIAGATVESMGKTEEFVAGKLAADARQGA
mgnify:CR=1 FL=1